MKRLFAIAFAAAVASPVMAGMAYRFESTTTGARGTTVVGRVEIEGTNVRLDIARGDGILFQDDSRVLSHDGGKTMMIINPAAKTYYTVQLEDLFGGGTRALEAMGDSIQISFENQKVNARTLGSGGNLSGYPTTHSVLDASYDMKVSAMGQKMTSHIVMKTESWTTDKIGPEFMSIFQMQGLKTGIEGLDKIIETQRSALKNGFPLKQITTMTIDQNGRKISTTTTAIVTEIQKRTIAATEFALPAGFKKVDSPIERMMRRR